MDPLTIGLITGGSSLLSDIFSKSQAEKQKRSAIEAYKKLLIPYSQSRIKADQYGDTVYTKAMSELNEGAFAYKGVLNPRVLQTIALSKMASARAQTETDVIRNDEAFNMNILSKIAEVEAQPVPEINPFNAVASGVEGYFAGKQFELAESLAKEQKDYLDLLKSSVPGITKVNDNNNKPNTNTTKDPFLSSLDVLNEVYGSTSPNVSLTDYFRGYKKWKNQMRGLNSLKTRYGLY